MLKSEEIKAKEARYNRVEREADKWGRLIGVRRLKPNEERRVRGMTSDLSGFEEIIGDDGKVSKIPLGLPHLITAMVCEIDNLPFTFPETRKELDAVYDRLDTEGVEAAMKAVAKLEEKREEKSVEGIVEEAKNL